jgi:cytochrome c peroxidase
MDPFTNPVELGLASTEDLILRLRADTSYKPEFQAAFPKAAQVPTRDQVSSALAGFLRSLVTGTSPFDRALADNRELSADSEVGKKLFLGAAHCGECHTVFGDVPRFSDGAFHHSGIEQSAQASKLAAITQTVVREDLDPPNLGQKVLTDPEWSSLGRFVVTHNPTDVGAFRTPSLRNVAATAPYMHDGSVATLSEAVDYEIYYRGVSRGHPTNLSLAERQALVAFLQTLTDSQAFTQPGAISETDSFDRRP